MTPKYGCSVGSVRNGHIVPMRKKMTTTINFFKFMLCTNKLAYLAPLEGQDDNVCYYFISHFYFNLLSYRKVIIYDLENT